MAGGEGGRRPAPRRQRGGGDCQRTADHLARRAARADDEEHGAPSSLVDALLRVVLVGMVAALGAVWGSAMFGGDDRSDQDSHDPVVSGGPHATLR